MQRQLMERRPRTGTRAAGTADRPAAHLSAAFACVRARMHSCTPPPEGSRQSLCHDYATTPTKQTQQQLRLITNPAIPHSSLQRPARSPRSQNLRPLRRRQADARGRQARIRASGVVSVRVARASRQAGSEVGDAAAAAVAGGAVRRHKQLLTRLPALRLPACLPQQLLPAQQHHQAAAAAA